MPEHLYIVTLREILTAPGVSRVVRCSPDQIESLVREIRRPYSRNLWSSHRDLGLVSDVIAWDGFAEDLEAFGPPEQIREVLEGQVPLPHGVIAVRS